MKKCNDDDDGYKELNIMEIRIFIVSFIIINMPYIILNIT
jgi:hypothetical protein